MLASNNRASQKNGVHGACVPNKCVCSSGEGAAIALKRENSDQVEQMITAQVAEARSGLIVRC
jgi:hypothetical protein